MRTINEQGAAPSAAEVVPVVWQDDQRGGDVQVLPSLAECEAVIERGRRHFAEAGAALRLIRDHRLYRDTHGTFEQYVRDRWQMSRPRAYQLIAASEMSTTVDIENEYQARRLRSGDPEPPAAGWRELQDSMSRVRDLSRVDAAVVASVVPARRRASVARDLRALGRVLGAIAARLEEEAL